MISETWNFLKTHELHKMHIPSDKINGAYIYVLAVANDRTMEWISCGHIAMKTRQSVMEVSP